MRKALVCSLVLHLAVVVLAYLGVPMAQKDIVAGSEAVAVDVVAVADTTNLPPPRAAREPAKAAPADPKPQMQKPQVQPPPKAASKPQPPLKPETVKKEAPPQEVKPSVPPAPAPVAKPQQVTKAEPQPPKPAPPQPTPVPDSQPASANLKPAPPPKPVQRQKPDQPASVAAAKSEPATAPGKAKPASEAKPAADFQSVLKAVETLKGSEPRKPSAEEPAPKKTAPKKTEDKAASPQTDARGAQTASAEKEMDALIGQTFGSGTTTAVAASSSQMYDPGQPMSVSEIDEVRRQIEKCWNIPAGARDAGDHVVTIRVEMSPDATPRSAVVVNKVSTQVNTFQQAAAESALRAVLNPRCHPFRLPREKYERWKTMTLVFNPKDMLGT